MLIILKTIHVTLIPDKRELTLAFLTLATINNLNSN